MCFLLSLKRSYIKNKRPRKMKQNIEKSNFQFPVYQRACFDHLPWLYVIVICCVWFGAWQTERDVQAPLEAIKVSENGQLAMQTSFRSISSTFGSWLGIVNGDGRKKISLYMHQSFGKMNVGHGNMKLAVSDSLLSLYPRSSSHSS